MVIFVLLFFVLVVFSYWISVTLRHRCKIAQGHKFALCLEAGAMLSLYALGNSTTTAQQRQGYCLLVVAVLTWPADIVIDEFVCFNLRYNARSDTCTVCLWRCRLEVAEQGGSYREIYSGYATAHKATGLSAGQRYVFRAQAVNEAGQGEWSPESPVVMALAPPPRPSSVSVTARFDDRHEGSVHADATILEVDWHHSDGQEANCTSTASFEVEACPCKDRSSQQRSSAVRQVVLQPPCRLAGLPADTCFAVRVRAVGARSAGHSKWSETAFATTPGWKKARPSTPSESNSSGTMVPASPRSSRSATSIVSEESLQSARGASRSAKKTQLRPRPRLRKSLWKTMKPYFTTSLIVAVVVLFVLLARGNLG